MISSAAKGSFLVAKWLLRNTECSKREIDAAMDTARRRGVNGSYIAILLLDTILASALFTENERNLRLTQIAESTDAVCKAWHCRYQIKKHFLNITNHLMSSYDVSAVYGEICAVEKHIGSSLQALWVASQHQEHAQEMDVYVRERAAFAAQVLETAIKNDRAQVVEVILGSGIQNIKPSMLESLRSVAEVCRAAECLNGLQWLAERVNRLEQRAAECQSHIDKFQQLLFTGAEIDALLTAMFAVVSCASSTGSGDSEYLLRPLNTILSGDATIVPAASGSKTQLLVEHIADKGYTHVILWLLAFPFKHNVDKLQDVLRILALHQNLTEDTLFCIVLSHVASLEDTVLPPPDKETLVFNLLHCMLENFWNFNHIQRVTRLLLLAKQHNIRLLPTNHRDVVYRAAKFVLENKHDHGEHVDVSMRFLEEVQDIMKYDLSQLTAALHLLAADIDLELEEDLLKGGDDELNLTVNSSFEEFWECGESACHAIIRMLSFFEHHGVPVHHTILHQLMQKFFNDSKSYVRCTVQLKLLEHFHNVYGVDVETFQIAALCPALDALRRQLIENQRCRWKIAGEIEKETVVSTIDELLQAEDSRESLRIKQKDGLTLLHIAALHDRVDVVELLLKNGMSAKCIDLDKRSVLSFSLLAGAMYVARYLAGEILRRACVPFIGFHGVDGAALTHGDVTGSMQIFQKTYFQQLTHK